VNPIRANVVPGVSPDVDDPNADMWFNTAAFADPAPFHLRNRYTQQRVGA
jgi:hypothetical protein